MNRLRSYVAELVKSLEALLIGFVRHSVRCLRGSMVFKTIIVTRMERNGIGRAASWLSNTCGGLQLTFSKQLDIPGQENSLSCRCGRAWCFDQSW